MKTNPLDFTNQQSIFFNAISYVQKKYYEFYGKQIEHKHIFNLNNKKIRIKQLVGFFISPQDDDFNFDTIQNQAIGFAFSKNYPTIIIVDNNNNFYVYEIEDFPNSRNLEFVFNSKKSFFMLDKFSKLQDLSIFKFNRIISEDNSQIIFDKQFNNFFLYSSPINSSNYFPLRPNLIEKIIIANSMNLINNNKKIVANEWKLIKEQLGSKTNTYSKSGYDLLRFHSYSLLLGIITDSMLETILLVSIRFNWRPENVLALWQIEGLAAWFKYERQKYFPLNLYSPPPVTWKTARAWARSQILFQRWGLDDLIPYNPGSGDNVPIRTTRFQHDDAFERGYRRECGSPFPISPLDYLNSSGKDAPISLKNISNWQFKTNPTYQSTMLALQHSLFAQRKYKIKIPSVYKGVALDTLTLPVVFNYLFYNSKNAQKHLESLFHRLVDYYKTLDHKKHQTLVSGKELYEFFINNPVPDTIRQNLVTRLAQANLIVDPDSKKSEVSTIVSSHGYVNALRFEFLRSVYAKLFDGSPVQTLGDPLLRDL